MVNQVKPGRESTAIPPLQNPQRRGNIQEAPGPHIRHIVIRFLALGLSLALLEPAAAAWAAPRTSHTSTPATDSDSGTPANASNLEKAQSYKQLGDRYISEDAINSAADAYQRALSLGRDQFTREDRTQMAVYLSWDNRLQPAIRELKLVLAKDPAYLSARVHLARTYGWLGDLKRSIVEADAVLAMQPGQKEALLIKANALEWGGQYDEAIPIYEGLIEADGGFDAHAGLSSSLLYKGDRAAAARQARNLIAETPSQKRKLRSLNESIDSEIKPRIGVRYNRYADEDHNLFDRYSARYNMPIGNQEFTMDLGHTESRGIGRSARADEFSLQSQFLHDGPVGFGGAFGLSRLHSDSAAQYATGQIRIDGRMPHTTLAFTMGSTMLTDTAELIDNRIRKTSAGIAVSQRIHERLLLSGAYGHMRFSDGNDANDVQMQSEFRLSLAPRVVLGYRGRFLDFERQSRSGFFDPNNYVSHRLYSGLYLKQSKFYLDFEVYYGHQDFRRYGERTKDWIAGGSGSIGITPLRGLVLEVNASGGDFAAGTVSGFRYFTLGSYISYRF